MINSVSGSSWSQLQSLARSSARPVGVAGSDGRSASSGLTDQPAVTLGINKPASQDQPAVTLGINKPASQEQPAVTLGVNKPASQEQPAVTLGVNKPASQEQPAVTLGVNQPASQEQPAVTLGVNKPASQDQPAVTLGVNQPASQDQPAVTLGINKPASQDQPAVTLEVNQPAPQEQPARPGVNQLAPQLTPQEQREVEALKQRDSEVKAHEQTHKAQLGPYATGGPFYTYKTGPDKNRYAVGGSVGVDTSKESTPEKTIQKAQTIKRASMAVSSPSSADKAVAGKAQQMEQQARAEMAREKQQERKISRELGAYQQADPAKDATKGINLKV